MDVLGNDLLVWADVETTGLSDTNDLLLEIAVVVTDPDLRTVGTPVSVVIGRSEQDLAIMEPVVRSMHTKSGLLEEVLESKETVLSAQHQVLEYVRRHIRQAATAPLCGSSIHFDRRFIARDMPDLDRWLHYRMIDVSTVKELSRRWYPQHPILPKTGRHRALSDIRESIEELMYYRAGIFLFLPVQAYREL